MFQDFSVARWNQKPIILYGAGQHGRIIAEGLKRAGIQDYKFCDRNFDENVLDPTDCIRRYRGANFIISSGEYCAEMYEILKNGGVEDGHIFVGGQLYCAGVDVLHSHKFREIPRLYSYSIGLQNLKAKCNGGWFLNHLDIITTEICTLNCAFCGSLMPLYEHPENISTDISLEALDHLLASGCYIGTLDIIGGEPFLNQPLMRSILQRYKDSEQIVAFQTISNGTVVPNDETCVAMQDNGRFYVIFSNYGELSKRQEEAAEKLDRYGIPYVILEKEDITSKDGTLWIDYGEVRHYDFPAEKHQKMFDMCMDGKECTTILKDKLYICPRIAHGVNIGMIPDNLDRLYIDLSKASSWQDQGRNIQAFLYHPIYPPACEWCNRDSGKLGKRAAQISRK